jgi:putative DNA primase/helicase
MEGTTMNQQFNRTLEAALSYSSERGWYVFPAPPGEKNSYLSAKYSGGRKWGATNDERLIREIFGQYRRANIGIGHPNL